MIIGIVGAMESEIISLRNQITKIALWKQAGCTIYTGQLRGVEVALVKSGIGKVFAALSTTLLLRHSKPEIVINTGVAGGLLPSLKIGDIIISREVRYHDVDVTAFGYEPGQIANGPISFHASSSLVELSKKISNRFSLQSIRGLIVSGDVFINSTKICSHIRQLFPHAIAVDMEVGAIAHVCHQFSIPFLAIRAISDMADQLTYPNCATKSLSIAIHNSSQFVLKMLQSLAIL